MSEFYAYNHDEPNPAIGGWMVDDFSEDPTGTRSSFATSLGDGLSAPSDAGGAQTAARPVWSELGGGTSHVSNDYIKMAFVNNNNHSQWRTAHVDNRTPTASSNLSVASKNFVWEFSFYMASGGNKDLVFFIEASSGMSTTAWASGAPWTGYKFQFDDSGNSRIWFKKFLAYNNQPTIYSSGTYAFSKNAWQTCKIEHTHSSDRWKLQINGTTIINGAGDSSFDTFYGYRFWTAKQANGSTDNRVDYIKTYQP